MSTADTLFSIQRHLMEEALAAGCRWRQVGRFGTLVNPRLDDPNVNHVRPLGVQPLDPWADRASFVEACAGLAECGRPVVVVFDPAQAPATLPAFLTHEHFVLEAREVFMVLAGDDTGSAPAPDITVVPVGVGPQLRSYARLWGQIFGDDLADTWLAAVEAIFRAEIAAGTTRYVCAL
ncbi:MAG TPA: hypothetical protein DEP84_33680, partial [Chloroflexi bacterium]|nr:hypothetical protein [Chloroflexota bacterium]